MRYSRINDDLAYPGRWHLGEPTTSSGAPLDARLFLEGRAAEVDGPLRIPLTRPGRPLDFTFAAFDMPVVTPELGDQVSRLAPSAVQRVPARVDGADGELEILNVLDVVACLDEQRSSIERWRPQDGRPEKIGQYRTIARMVIDPLLAAGRPLFRLAGWRIALPCSDAFRQELASRGPFTGLRFQPVG